ncbi:hypothetical protein [Streptosporangium sp. NPDC006007]|uniref:hypothetical protein n=1 Tax=Streptosporangium sp. NPDC006007 TaxID=3154575 RepID=UPI0033BA4559
MTVQGAGARPHHGTARWRARYTFAGTGRRVVNDTEALPRSEGGLIIRHHDDFDFRHWSTMAPGGPAGPPLGRPPMFRATIRGGETRSPEESLDTG